MASSSEPAAAQRPLSYEIAVLIVAANGALDAYTFIAHDQVFANAQTGNVVFLAMGLLRPDITAPLPHLWPVLAFIAGIAVARVVHRPAHAGPPRRRRWVLIAQVLVLSVVAALPASFPLGVIVSVISFMSALQLALFRSVESLTFVPIAMTGNLMRATEAVHDAASGGWSERRDALAQFGLVVVFGGGVVLGTLSTTHLGTRAAAVPAGLFLVDVVWLRLRARRAT